MEYTDMTQQAAELLMRMVEIPSVSRDEQAVADLLLAHMDRLGMEPQRSGNNLWSITPLYDKDKPTLLLNAHIDTVKPVSSWSYNPYKATLSDGRIYGLGTNDDGASVVALLHTYLSLKDKPQHYNLLFLASCEEEVSGRGGIESVLPLLPPIQVGLVGEPTGMHPAIAEKGLMVLDVTAHGRPGHAARNEGDNAIYKAMKDMEWFRDYRFEKESDLLGAVKMTVTIVNAGTQHNVIPDSCTFTVDVRSNEHYSNHDIYETVCQHVQSEVKARSFRLNSSGIAVSHPLVQGAIALGRQPFGSPTLSDQALMPFSSLKMGPGNSARSHTADEYVTLDELHEALRLYHDLLDGLTL